jgi:hypothetical protein
LARANHGVEQVLHDGFRLKIDTTVLDDVGGCIEQVETNDSMSMLVGPCVAEGLN